MEGFIGIDLGTSGCRACVINQQGELLAQARTELPVSRILAPGHAEQTPDDWWRAALTLLDKLLTQRTFIPKAISIDGTSATLLVCDQHGQPLTSGLMYNDARAVSAARKLQDIAPPDSPVHGPSSALAKLIHLHHNQAFDNTAHALHQADWIAGKLMNQFHHSDENNALKLGYDPVQRRWPEWLEQLPDITCLLPKVAPVGAWLGVVNPTLLSRWRCTEPIQVIAGTTDSNAAAIAAGIQRHGDAVTSLGSTLVLKVLSDKPLFCAKYGIYSHRLPHHWLVGGASNSGGRTLAQYFSDVQIARLSECINPDDASGLNYYPLPQPGERFPINDPEMPPRLSPRPENDALFLHGMLEGIANIERQGYQLLNKLGAPYPKQIISSGGGARNETWRRMRRRILHVPVETAENPEAAYGTALLAAQMTE